MLLRRCAEDFGVRKPRSRRTGRRCLMLRAGNRGGQSDEALEKPDVWPLVRVIDGLKD